MIRAVCSPSPCGLSFGHRLRGVREDGSAAGMAVASTSSSPSRTSHSLNVIESSRDGPPTRDRRQPRAGASVGQSPSRWTISMIDGSSRATGVRVGRPGRQRHLGPPQWPAPTLGVDHRPRHHPPVGVRAVTVTHPGGMASRQFPGLWMERNGLASRPLRDGFHHANHGSTPSFSDGEIAVHAPRMCRGLFR